MKNSNNKKNANQDRLYASRNKQNASELHQVHVQTARLQQDVQRREQEA